METMRFQLTRLNHDGAFGQTVRLIAVTVFVLAGGEPAHHAIAATRDLGDAALCQICLMPIELAIGGTAIVGCAVAAGI